MSGTVTYSGPLNGYLEPLGGSVRLKGTVEYSGSEGPEKHEGLFKLQMFGGIVLLDEAGNSLGTIIPSQVIKATGERPQLTKGNSVSWYPEQRNVVVVN